MKRALLIIDVQNEYITGRMPVTHPPGSLPNILKAMDAAAASGVPVILVRHTAPQPDSPVFAPGSTGWELHPEVAARPADLLIEKSLPGSFTGTGLDDHLANMGVDTVTIAGYMTQMCCDTTARQAVHRGLAVEFLSDATGTLAVTNPAGSVTAEELHRAILVTQAMRFSDVLSTARWIGRLAG